MKLIFKLLVICLLGAMHAEGNPQPEDTGLSEEVQHIQRRYAESTIASEISKIMDSMQQKNFVDFLLNQREKKSRLDTGENDAETDLFNDLLELQLREKQRRNI